MKNIKKYKTLIKKNIWNKGLGTIMFKIIMLRWFLTKDIRFVTK